MKKVKTLLSSLLVVGLTLSLLACGVGNDTNKNNVNKEENIYTATIADFDTFTDIYNLVDVVSNYSFEGYTTQSTKDKAITGDGSLQWHITGSLIDQFYLYSKNSGISPMLHYSLWYNTKNEGNWGFKWEEVTNVVADVRNDNDFEITISMFYLTRNYYPVGFSTESIVPGETKTVNLMLNRYFMQNELDKTISYLCIKCDYAKKVLDNGDLYYPAADVYIDNIKATVNKNPIVDEHGVIDIDKQFVGNEILSFNDASDLDYLFVTASNYVKDSDNQWLTRLYRAGHGSSLKHNTNQAYVKEGNTGSLCWTVSPIYINDWGQSNYTYFSMRNYTYQNTWTGFTLCHEFLDYYNFAKVMNGQAKIQVDVYNAGDYDKEVAFGMHDRNAVAEGSQFDFPFGYGEVAPTDTWYKLKAGEWTTLEITDFSKIDFSAGLGRLRLFTSIIDVNEPINFYVNDLRIVEI